MTTPRVKNRKARPVPRVTGEIVGNESVVASPEWRHLWARLLAPPPAASDTANAA